MALRLIALITGLVFGLGLALSGMLNPTKVFQFLNITGAWDPSLAFVMGGGLIVNAIGHLIIRRRASPLISETFHLPQSTLIDRPLIIGSAIFGVGWALGGLCPGPAIASLAFTEPEPLIFFVALCGGLLLSGRAKLLLTHSKSSMEA